MPNICYVTEIHPKPMPYSFKGVNVNKCSPWGPHAWNEKLFLVNLESPSSVHTETKYPTCEQQEINLLSVQACLSTLVKLWGMATSYSMSESFIRESNWYKSEYRVVCCGLPRFYLVKGLGIIIHVFSFFCKNEDVCIKYHKWLLNGTEQPMSLFQPASNSSITLPRK